MSRLPPQKKRRTSKTLLAIISRRGRTNDSEASSCGIARATVIETSPPVPDPEEPIEIETRPLSPDVATPLLIDRLPPTPAMPASELGKHPHRCCRHATIGYCRWCGVGCLLQLLWPAAGGQKRGIVMARRRASSAVGCLFCSFSALLGAATGCAGWLVAA
jgi:hypothetical protein